MKLKITCPIHKTLIGFFIYFAVFSMVTLPMVFGQARFLSLCLLWLIIFAVVTIVGIVYLKKTGNIIRPDLGSPSSKSEFLALIGLGIFLVFALSFIVIQPIMGWDTVYYIGSMNDAIFNDRMYITYPNEGIIAGSIDVKHAINAPFFMQFAMIAKLLGIRPITVSYYLARPVGFFLTAMIAYLIGIVAFEKREYAMATCGLAIFIKLVWFSHLSTAFFNQRLYEGKGFCQNVILPAALFCFICIWKNMELQRADTATLATPWKMLFIISLSSVGVSASSLFTLPAMIALCTLGLWVKDFRNTKTILRGFICVLPCLAYFLFYYLGNNGTFEFEIHI